MSEISDEMLDQLRAGQLEPRVGDYIRIALTGATGIVRARGEMTAFPQLGRVYRIELLPSRRIDYVPATDCEFLAPREWYDNG